jgi:hypothetical protein
LEVLVRAAAPVPLRSEAEEPVAPRP